MAPSDALTESKVGAHKSATPDISNEANSRILKISMEALTN
jgi:hypothetical protein